MAVKEEGGAKMKSAIQMHLEVILVTLYYSEVNRQSVAAADLAKVTLFLLPFPPNNDNGLYSVAKDFLSCRWIQGVVP